MSLRIRKLIVLALAGGVFLLANLMIIATWLDSIGALALAGSIRREFLTGTAITIIVVLLILLMGPASRNGGRRCQVCDHPGAGKYCPDCGSRT